MENIGGAVISSKDVLHKSLPQEKSSLISFIETHGCSIKSAYVFAELI
jgi:hypothetical protein